MTEFNPVEVFGSTDPAHYERMKAVGEFWNDVWDGVVSPRQSEVALSNQSAVFRLYQYAVDREHVGYLQLAQEHLKRQNIVTGCSYRKTDGTLWDYPPRLK